MHTKRFNTFFKRLEQFRVGAIPRLLFFANQTYILLTTFIETTDIIIYYFFRYSQLESTKHSYETQQRKIW